MRQLTINFNMFCHNLLVENDTIKKTKKYILFLQNIMYTKSLDTFLFLS